MIHRFSIDLVLHNIILKLKNYFYIFYFILKNKLKLIYRYRLMNVILDLDYIRFILI
jgi:hypothetical protein